MGTASLYVLPDESKSVAYLSLDAQSISIAWSLTGRDMPLQAWSGELKCQGKEMSSEEEAREGKCAETAWCSYHESCSSKKVYERR